jgi:putative transcriptional regulator
MIVNHLAQLLDERDMTLADLQRETGLTYANLHKLAKGKTKRTDFETLDVICAALGVGVGELLEHVPGGNA